MMMTMAIRFEDETWQRLNARKNPGGSVDDTTNQLLDEPEELRQRKRQPQRDSSSG